MTREATTLLVATGVASMAPSLATGVVLATAAIGATLLLNGADVRRRLGGLAMVLVVCSVVAVVLSWPTWKQSFF